MKSALRKNLLRHSRILAAAGLVALPATSVWAAEGGVGRPITGMQVIPLGGILPTEPGLLVSFSSIYYDASSNRSTQLPIAGKLSSDVDYLVSYNLLSLVYVWTNYGQWTIGSGVSLPLQYTDISATIHGPLGGTYGLSDSSTQLADMLFTPVMLDYHFDATDHMLLSLQIFAPTGSYDSNRLANAGQNTWTFIPNIVYTTIIPSYNIEFTSVLAFEFYTQNDDTDYTNGVLGRLDILGIKRFENGFGVGLNFGWIQQLNSDTGPLADQLHGNRGYSVGLGPIVTYEKKIGDYQLSTSFRWVNELATHNRPKGNVFQLSLTMQF